MRAPGPAGELTPEDRQHPLYLAVEEAQKRVTRVNLAHKQITNAVRALRAGAAALRAVGPEKAEAIAQVGRLQDELQRVLLEIERDQMIASQAYLQALKRWEEARPRREEQPVEPPPEGEVRLG
ncbi:MAG TPA: hypothetical protein VIN09_06935 [Chloroflexota bacterium]